MSDEQTLAITRTETNSSLTPIESRSRLVARGRKDAAMLVSTAPAMAVEAILGAICETCGERRELTTPDDGFCPWCRPCEHRITAIWEHWGFDRWGRPRNGAWDVAAQYRDIQAKVEINRLLADTILPPRWIELWWGFGESHYEPIRRGQIQALSVASAVNRKWGFDDEGSPTDDDWDQEAESRATLALEEVKAILA